MQIWLEGRIWVGERCTSTGMTASLRILSSKADSNTWESFTRSGLKLESVHQESPRSDVFRKRATKHFWTRDNVQKHLTWAVEKNNWLLLSGPKSSFQMKVNFAFSFGNQGPRVWRKSGEAQNPCCLKSSVKFPQSVMIWAAMSSAGVGHCVSEVHSQRSHLPGNFRALHASFCDKLYWEADFISSRTWHLPTLPKVLKLVQWPWCYCAWLASKLARPEPHRESMRDTRPNNADELKASRQSNLGFHTTSAVPQTDHLHATPNWGSN